jgi:hypothetical protein
MEAIPRAATIGLLLLGMAGSAAFIARAVAARARTDPNLRPTMARQIDGGLMEQYLESPAEKQAVLRWVKAGAPERGWKEIARIFEERCLSCHFSGAERLVPLDDYAPAAAVSRPRSVLREKIEWGSMAKYFEDPAEKLAVLRWSERGAPEGEWSEVATLLARRCVSCHNPEGVRGLAPLDRYARVARLAAPPEPERTPLALALSTLSFFGAGILLRRIWRRG